MIQLDAEWLNYIDGEWMSGGAGWIDVTNPANGELLARQALADAADVDRAVQAARRLHLSGELSALRPIARGRMVQEMGRYLLDHIGEIAGVLTLEQGKPLWESRIEIEGAALYFEYYGNQASTVEGRSIPLGGGYFDWTENEPMGVSAQIIPWNYPVEMTARSLAAALATGNACVIKTPELTPLTNAWLARAAVAAGFPRGAVNILCGYGHEAGAALSANPQVNQIVFTGSVPTGIRIATAAAQNVVPCVLELGGKSAAIVHEDADLDAFENDIRWGIYFNAGQVCSAMSRVIVHESRHDELVERAVNVANSLSTGPGIDRNEFGANMGAMVSMPQRDRALGIVQQAQSDGAAIATGGTPVGNAGAFLAPTVVCGISPNDSIAREEIFGPVLSVLKFRSDAEAIGIANSTEYGLVGGVFTRDLDRATRCARQLRAGQVFVNEWYAGGVETPFGGYGKSGYGREKGREALWNYVQTKNIAMKLRG
ncbi:aldehyde dehydrogenase family protein [Leisingera methylohalidivorans]|uniref:Aldehyde dehydrogenase n=1 Tax=Leisingera methylohalidivorans DSM 14336 TaxID=999552 RepID=V9VSW1_9RHOB|nr:aldehyde dehydrogenase family protein [Leisingera methylohalidivorans]AHC99961.1 aldehyde dehydrogenase [Leisingera methylohalidivorans DSM 14336]